MQSEIDRLKRLLDNLSDDARLADQRNQQRKSHYYLQQQALFDDRLFNRSFDSYSGYLPGIKQKLNQLQRLLNENQEQLSFTLLEQLQQQILSLITAIKANDNRHHDSDYRLQRRQRLSSQRIKNVAKTIFRPTQELYQKLSEYQGFERRLEQMLIDEQDKMKRKTSQDTELQNRVLALHQRLGRCRQAIAKLELEIEQQEKR